MSRRSTPEDLLRVFELGDDDRAAWHDSELPEAAFEDWLTDRVARRPAGDRARSVYGEASVRDFAGRAILVSSRGRTLRRLG